MTVYHIDLTFRTHPVNTLPHNPHSRLAVQATTYVKPYASTCLSNSHAHGHLCARGPRCLLLLGQRGGLVGRAASCLTLKSDRSRPFPLAPRFLESQYFRHRLSNFYVKKATKGFKCESPYANREGTCSLITSWTLANNAGLGVSIIVAK